MNFRRRFFEFVPGALLGFFLVTLPSLAAEGAEPNPADSPAGQIFRWLNFAIVFGGIAFLITKYGGSFFKSNAKAIAASIHEGTAAKEEADRQLQEMDAKIAHLDQDVTEIRETARRDSAAETERLTTSAKIEIEKIETAARAELGAAERAARQELRVIAASMAINGAGSLVSSRMNKDVRSRLLRAFLADLGRSAN